MHLSTEWNTYGMVNYSLSLFSSLASLFLYSYIHSALFTKYKIHYRLQQILSLLSQTSLIWMLYGRHATEH